MVSISYPKIVLVTSGQPSANPRLVKESKTFLKQGFSVTVIYCPITDWAIKFDYELISINHEIKWIRVGKPQSEYRFYFLLYRLRRKFWSIVYILIGDVFDSCIKSSVLFSQELKKEALKHKANIYIGHNLGSIKSIVTAAEKYGGKSYFDFEDFHRGEDSFGSFHWNKVKKIENKFVHRLNGAWAASPYIKNEYLKLYPNLKIGTINNCFSKEYGLCNLQPIEFRQLKLFWFSQNIGKNRGLEQIIQSIGAIKDKDITISLLGNHNSEIINYFVQIALDHGMNPDRINFLKPVGEKEIVQIASNHHVGIASEVPQVLNRELCLTNKIFMYILSGNAIIFSNTLAQKQFLNQHPNIGLIYKVGDIDNSTRLIKAYLENRDLLNTHRLNSLNLSSKLNWENEQYKLLNLFR